MCRTRSCVLVDPTPPDAVARPFAPLTAKLQKTFADSPKSWSVDAKSIDRTTFDLSVKNPNGGDEIAHRSPADIMDEIAALDAESAKVLENIKALL